MSAVKTCFILSFKLFLVVNFCRILVICVDQLGANTWYDLNGLLKGALSHTWIPFNESEALNYYTMFEVCHLFHTDATDRDKCKLEPGRPSIYSCGAYGEGIGSRYTSGGCVNLAGAFLRHISISPDSFNMVHVMQSMLSQGYNTLIILGDSVSNQFFSDAVCNLNRADFHVVGYNDDENSTLRIRGARHGYFVHVPLDMTNATYDLFKNQYKIPVIGDRKQPFFNILFVQLYAPEDDLPPLRQRLESVETHPSVKGKLLIMFNMGLHIKIENASKYFPIHFKTLFNALTGFILRGHRVYFRETGAVHKLHTHTHEGYKSGLALRRKEVLFPSQYQYPATTADAIKELVATPSNNKYETSLTYRCEPIDIQPTWRVIWAQDLISEFNIDLLSRINSTKGLAEDGSKIYVIETLPFFNVSLPRYDYHVARNYDCTHYCYGPMIFAPVWNNLARSLRGLPILN